MPLHCFQNVRETETVPLLVHGPKNIDEMEKYHNKTKSFRHKNVEKDDLPQCSQKIA